MIPCFSAQNLYLGRLWFTSYSPKCSCPIRLQDSLIIVQYLWKDSIDKLDFLHGDSHYGKVGTETITFCWLWPGMPSHAQMCLDFVGCHWLVW